MNTQPSATTPQKVYRQVGIWRTSPLFILLIGLGLAIMFLILFFTGTRFDIASRIISLVAAVIMAALGILLFVGLQQVRLVTSPQGVLLYGVGYRVYTPWSNIKDIVKDWYGGNDFHYGQFNQPSQRVEGFLFYHPAVFSSTIEEGMRNQVAVIQGMALMAVRISRFSNMLPLTGFLDATTRQELIDTAKKYAPQTFQHAQNNPVNHLPVYSE